MNNQFLFELGTEEIPASMIDDAVNQLRGAFTRILAEKGVQFHDLSAYSTPRRLAVLLEGLPSRCPEREEVFSGPPASLAYDAEGKPTPAAQGFARKLGVEVGELRVEDTERGAYLILRRAVPGEPLRDVLAQALPAIIGSLSWPKTMYWTESRFRFIRPLRWFACLWNDEIVPFELEGVRSGRTSAGHRLIGEHRVTIPSPDQYLDRLRSAFVLADSAERKNRIEEGLKREAGNLEVLADPELLDTVVHLNEFPSVLRGEFNAGFLEIPREVLVTVMRYHQKYFSLTDKEGRLAPSFLTVINTSGDPDGRIRRGHEKVLQARLEDAAFFWNADRKVALRDRLETLEHVLFQENLGSYFAKTERIRVICAELGGNPGLDEAALLCKVDLTTDMVRELSELQGIMGGLYAREEGLPEGVWRAIYDHYLPVSLDGAFPKTSNGVLLSIADRIDSIVGCFGVGIVPSGSSDPFALRRQAQGLISLLLASRLDFELEFLANLALRNFPQFEPDQVKADVIDFLHRRLAFILQREGLEPDVLRAVFAAGITSVPDALERARAVAEIRGNNDFSALAVAFKRAKNLLSKSGEAISAVDPGLFVDPGETDLFEALGRLRPRLEEALGGRDYLTGVRTIARIRPAVDRFFDDVLVMDENPRLRRNRLALLGAVADLVLSIADPSEIVQQGGENES